MSEADPNGLNQHTAGAKLDAGKIDMSLLTLWPRALREVCRVGTLGASKYSRGGFLSVANGFLRYTAAMLRHLFKESVDTYDDDPYYDTEAGSQWKGTIRHDAQVAWNALSRLEVKLIAEEEEKNKKNEASHKQHGIAKSFATTGQITPVPAVQPNLVGCGFTSGTGSAGPATGHVKSVAGGVIGNPGQPYRERSTALIDGGDCH